MTKLLRTPLHFRYYNLATLRSLANLPIPFVTYSFLTKFLKGWSKQDSNDENFEILWYDDQIAQVHWFQLQGSARACGFSFRFQVFSLLNVKKTNFSTPRAGHSGRTSNLPPREKYLGGRWGVGIAQHLFWQRCHISLVCCQWERKRVKVDPK